MTQKELKELLQYNIGTGIFTWKIRKRRYREPGNIAGTTSVNGYWVIRINNKLYYAHRLAFLYMEGYFPEHQVDHINRIKDDNRWCNLREVSRQCNSKNCGPSSKNTSGVVGVIWLKRDDKWCSRLAINKKQIHLGQYKNKDNAVKARWEAEKKYGWPNCNTTSSAYLYLKKRNLL